MFRVHYPPLGNDRLWCNDATSFVPFVCHRVIFFSVCFSRGVWFRQLGYGERGDLPVDPKWRPFSALTWLEKEHDKKVQEEYNEKRAQLYEERCSNGHTLTFMYYMLCVDIMYKKIKAVVTAGELTPPEILFALMESKSLTHLAVFPTRSNFMVVCLAALVYLLGACLSRPLA